MWGVFQFWRRLFNCGGKHKREWTGRAGAFDVDEVVQQYLAALPCPACVYLSPRRMLRIIPAQPQPAAVIYRAAVQAEMIPRGVSFKVFKEALKSLTPLILNVSTPLLLGAGQEDVVVAWQPWVSHKWRAYNFDNSTKVDQSALEMELCSVVPSYFVASSLVRDQIRFCQFKAAGSAALEWEKLANPQLARLLEWSDDHRLVRLSSRMTGRATADGLYSLKTHPELFHKALNALVLLLPTFMVSEKQVRCVYSAQFASSDRTYCAEFDQEFIARFPESRALTDHPDLQFAVQRDDSECLMLCPHFLHTNRGVPNSLYEMLSSCRSDSTLEEGTSYHGNDHKHNLTGRHVFQATLPYNSSDNDRTALREIPKKGLLGLRCALETEKDRFNLTIATIDGHVFDFNGSASSLCRLSVAGVPHGGLPSEVVGALVSPEVVKIVAVDSAREEDCVSEDIRVVSHLSHFFDLQAQTVCSLWKWAMFVGFPVHPSLGVSTMFHRRLLKRLGVAMAPCTPTVLVAVVCASRLLSLHEADGYCIDTATLNQMLRENDRETWRRRNLELRIRRYGAEPNDEGSQLGSRDHFLRHLSSLYGPEVCVVEKQTAPTFTAASSRHVAFEAPRLSGEETEKPRGKREEEEKCAVREYVDAPCAVLDDTTCADPKSPEEKKEVEEEREMVPQDYEQVGDNELLDALLGDGDAAGEEVAVAKTTPSRKTDLVEESFPNSNNNNNNNNQNNNDKSGDFSQGKSQFLFSLPNSSLEHKKKKCINGPTPQPLPPSFTTFATLPKKSEPKNFFHVGPRAPSEKRGDLALNNRHVEDVESEKEIIERLTREIVRETRRRSFKDSSQEKGQAESDAADEEMVEFLRNMLRSATKS